VALLLHRYSVVNRRIALVLTALILPGGLVILVGAAVIKAFYRTEAGRKAWGRVTHLWRRPTQALGPVREAA
jgi:hypothetical protein